MHLWIRTEPVHDEYQPDRYYRMHFIGIRSSEGTVWASRLRLEKR